MSEPRGHGDGRRERRPARKLAEWVTMAVSSAIVVGVAAFLAREAALDNVPFVAVEVRPLFEQAREEQGHHILPVQVRNLGHRTVQDFEGELVYQTPEGQTETRTFKIDYLGEEAEQTVYFYLDKPPRRLDVRARPHSYTLE